MKFGKPTFLACVIALGLGGCSLLGIDPEDSASARDEASRIVKVLRTVDGVVGIAVTEANSFCADAANANKWPCTTDYPGAAKKVSDLIGEHLAKLDEALSAPTSDDELFIALTKQGWDAWGDAMNVINELRGISPAAEATVAEAVTLRRVTDESGIVAFVPYWAASQLAEKDYGWVSKEKGI